MCAVLVGVVLGLSGCLEFVDSLSVLVRPFMLSIQRLWQVFVTRFHDVLGKFCFIFGFSVWLVSMFSLFS